MKYYYINKKRVSELEYFKQNFEDINPQRLTTKQLKKYATVYKDIQKKEKRAATNLKISQKAKERIRVNGRFISKEETQRIKFFLGKLSLPYNQQNVNLAKAKTLIFTANNDSMAAKINDHKGTVSIDGVIMAKSEAIAKFDERNNLNRYEWAGRNEISPSEIYLLIYKCEFDPTTRNLNIITVIDDNSMIINKS